MNDNEITEKKFFVVYEYLLEIKDFDINDVIIYSIIKSLNTNGKDCYATNGYFAKRIKKNNDTVRKSITKLFENGYIEYTKDFKHQSNRVLTVTNKIDAYLKTKEGLLKNTIGVTKNHNSTLVKNSNNNIDNNININTSTTTKKLESNIDLIRGISKDLNIDEKNVYDKIPKFIEFIKEVKRVHKSDSDLFLNFKYWMNSREQNEKNYLKENEVNYLWFMNLFDKISNGTHIRDDETRELLYKHLKNGVTGDDCRKAIKNLYSSSPKNDWHLKTSYKFATPKYLLNHFNKYLNFKL